MWQQTPVPYLWFLVLISFWFLVLVSGSWFLVLDLILEPNLACLDYISVFTAKSHLSWTSCVWSSLPCPWLYQGSFWQMGNPGTLCTDCRYNPNCLLGPTQVTWNSPRILQKCHKAHLWQPVRRGYWCRELLCSAWICSINSADPLGLLQRYLG